MQRLIPRAILVLVVLIGAILAVNPPKEKLRLGKDLQGGATLVYSVQIKPGENATEVIARTIDVLKQRVDPDGLGEIAIVAQGRDRIEISMPLPRAEVKVLKKSFESELEKLAKTAVSETKLNQIARLPPEQRDAEFGKLAGDNPSRRALLAALGTAYDAATQARASITAAQTAGESQEAIDKLVDAAAQAEVSYDEALKAIARASLSPSEVRRALSLSDTSRGLLDKATGQMVSPPSPRARAIDRIQTEHPEAKEQLEKILEAHKAYTSSRRTMDDPADLVRQLRGAGVLSFRITVKPEWDRAEIARLREQLKEQGPRNVRSTDVRWYKINQLRTWYDDVQSLRMLEADPEGYFAERYRAVAAEYDGEYYILCFDTRNTRLTTAEGQWGVAGSHETRDELGRPAIGFDMDPRGAFLLGNLTREHVGEQMAVLLDDEVYTAPTLQSAISSGGRISGEFSPEELRYIIRVLGAGSLQAKLSPEPLSISSVGPDLGLDNLQMGFKAGVLSLIVVSAFMIIYYFSCGFIAVISLLCNTLLILGAMSLNKAAFTMPGIAGMILTFGMAVDSNVLIYERMREEFRRGADLKTAIRLGFDRAMSSIVDGNVTNLIVCVVLYYFGTQEIRGFAITMGIGVVTTLFGVIVISRLIFDALVLPGFWKKASMLPMAFPRLERALMPSVNWLRLRWVFFAMSTLYVGIGLYMVFVRGEEMLDNEFRGGTQVTVVFKEDPATGKPFTMTRKEVEDRIDAVAAKAAPSSPVAKLATAEILPIDPQADGVTSDQFTIKTVAENREVITNAITTEFADFLEMRPPIRFVGSDEADFRKAPVYRDAYAKLGESIDRPGVRDDVTDFVGGVAVVFADLAPPQKLETLRQRLAAARSSPDFAETSSRQTDVRILAGDENAVTSAVLLVRDETVNFADNEGRFDTEVAAREWNLVREALTHSSTPASVVNFSAVIAQTFKAKAISATLISFLGITIYIWVRFKTFRYALAAIIALLHDVLTVLGLLALCEILYSHPSTQQFAMAIGLLPFKIDLNMVAALLTIAGYSLNDTIVIMDRIRENRGKMLHATGDMINTAINQTFSRTLLTGGTTLASCLILYVYGGEGVRAFSFALLTGLIVGTYSSIAVAAPIVWSRRVDEAPVA